MYLGSSTSAKVENKSTELYSLHFKRHDSILPTAGGQDQEVLQRSHSVSQIYRTLSLNLISLLSKNPYWKIGYFASMDSTSCKFADVIKGLSYISTSAAWRKYAYL